MGLVLIDINEKALKATADVLPGGRLEGRGPGGRRDQGRRPSSARSKETLDNFGKVDFLINYAGGALKVAPIEEMDDAINRRIIDLNLTSTIMSCRTFTPQFKQQGYGKIINVSSACDRRSWPGWSVYSAAKAARQRLHQVPLHRAAAARHRRHAARAGRIQHRLPGGGSRASTSSSGTRSWRCAPSTSPTWCTRPALSPRAAASSEMLVYGLAQDVSGF